MAKLVFDREARVSDLNSHVEEWQNKGPQAGTMVGHGQFFIYLPERADERTYVRTPVKVKAEMILSPNQLDWQNVASITIPCRARVEKVSADHILSVINVPIKIEAELLLTPEMSFMYKKPINPRDAEMPQNVTDSSEPDLQRPLSISRADKYEEDLPKTLGEVPVESGDLKAAACEGGSRGDEAAGVKKLGDEEMFGTSHRVGFHLPAKNMEGPSELFNNFQPYYQAVRRRETLMKELGMKLKDELKMRRVHRYREELSCCPCLLSFTKLKEVDMAGWFVFKSGPNIRISIAEILLQDFLEGL
ncbi:hypothetical protein R1sor_023152 [Riccia sorocarpa]|uniref:Uncharacterized protein n=1 Tax=Riccia sorocarpa TaxID=122646 RepID=A0ABD3GNE0_9MARC